MSRCTVFRYALSIEDRSTSHSLGCSGTADSRWFAKYVVAQSCRVPGRRPERSLSLLRRPGGIGSCYERRKRASARIRSQAGGATKTADGCGSQHGLGIYPFRSRESSSLRVVDGALCSLRGGCRVPSRFMEIRCRSSSPRLHAKPRA